MTVRHAIRGFTVVMVLAGVATAIAAAEGLRSGTGASGSLAIVLPLAMLPGALAWWQPRPRSLAIWLVVAGTLATGYRIAGWPSRYQLTAQGDTALAMFQLAGTLLFVALPVVMFAALAAGRDAWLGDPRTHRIRRVVHLAFAIALALAALAMLPGQLVYADIQHTELLRTEPAGGFSLIVFLIVLLAPGPLVHADPRRGPALIWTMWTIPSSILAVVATFDLHLFESAVSLWPRVAVELGVGTLLVLLLVVLPLAALSSTPPAPVLPEARIRR